MRERLSSCGAVAAAAPVAPNSVHQRLEQELFNAKAASSCIQESHCPAARPSKIATNFAVFRITKGCILIGAPAMCPGRSRNAAGALSRLSVSCVFGPCGGRSTADPKLCRDFRSGSCGFIAVLQLLVPAVGVSPAIRLSSARHSPGTRLAP